MILRAPDFLRRFRCTASACTDTCCVGWEIGVDEESQERYRKIEGPLGEKLRANVADGRFRTLDGNRCPFLDGRNLCEIQAALGEGALCAICREHPRFVNLYGDLEERGLGLCCEEAVRLLFENDDPLAFEAEEIPGEGPALDDGEREALFAVVESREALFGLLARNDVPLDERLKGVLLLAGELQGLLDEMTGNGAPGRPGPRPDERLLLPPAEILALLEKTESCGARWDEALARVRAAVRNGTAEDRGFLSDAQSAKLAAWLLFRHYGNAFFDGRALSKARFALLFLGAARLFARELAGPESRDPRLDAVKLLSRQLEYSEENMALLDAALGQA